MRLLSAHNGCDASGACSAVTSHHAVHANTRSHTHGHSLLTRVREHGERARALGPSGGSVMHTRLSSPCHLRRECVGGVGPHKDPAHVLGHQRDSARAVARTPSYMQSTVTAARLRARATVPTHSRRPLSPAPPLTRRAPSPAWTPSMPSGSPGAATAHR